MACEHRGRQREAQQRDQRPGQLVVPGRAHVHAQHAVIGRQRRRQHAASPRVACSVQVEAVQAQRTPSSAAIQVASVFGTVGSSRPTIMPGFARRRPGRVRAAAMAAFTAASPGDLSAPDVSPGEVDHPRICKGNSHGRDPSAVAAPRSAVLQHRRRRPRNRRDGRFIERAGFYNPVAARWRAAARLAPRPRRALGTNGAQLCLPSPAWSTKPKKAA